ncbi:hypothetical protein G9A89_009728 [Geosiphon pyriformis]|nr:hypothetical protein G9A89_009728 [Geosiphon pyriformis]
MPGRRKQYEPPPSSGATSVNIATAFNQARTVTPVRNSDSRTSRQSSRKDRSISPASSSNGRSLQYAPSPKYTTYLKERSPVVDDAYGSMLESAFSREEELLREWELDPSLSPLGRENEYFSQHYSEESEPEEVNSDLQVASEVSDAYEEEEKEKDSEEEEEDERNPNEHYDSPTPRSSPSSCDSPMVVSDIQKPPVINASRDINYLGTDNGNRTLVYARLLGPLKFGLRLLLWPLEIALLFIGWCLFIILATIKKTAYFFWRNLTGHGQYVAILQTEIDPSSSSSPALVTVATVSGQRGTKYWWIFWILILFWLLWYLRLAGYLRENQTRFWPITWSDRNTRIPGFMDGTNNLEYLRELIRTEVRLECSGDNKKSSAVSPSTELIEPNMIEFKAFISKEVKTACEENSVFLEKHLQSQVDKNLDYVKSKVKSDVTTDVNNDIRDIKNGVKINIDEIRTKVTNDISGIKNEVKDIREVIKTDISKVNKELTNVRSQFNNKLNSLKSELENGIKTDMNSEFIQMKNEIRYEFRGDINGLEKDIKLLKIQVKDEIKDAIHSQVKGDFRSDLKNEVKNEVRNDISNEIKTQMSKSKSLRTTTSWKGGEDMMEIIRTEARKIVSDELLVFSQDKLNRPDFALHSGGAKIISRYTSKTYELWPDKWYQKFFAQLSGQGILRGKPPVTAISPDTHVGQCWPFPGKEGQLAVLLNRRVYVTAITYDHVSKQVTVDVMSAPKDFEVWGIIDEGVSNSNRGSLGGGGDAGEENVDDLFTETAEGDMESTEEECGFREDGQYVTHKNNIPPTSSSQRPSALTEIDPKTENATSDELKLGSSPAHFFLGSYTYDINGLPVQTFEVPEQIRSANRPIRAIIMKVNSNWGKPGYTCLYRFRVHGDPADKVEVH